MHTHRHLRKPVLVALFTIATLALGAADALATHFRYGTITWSVPNPANPNQVVIRFDAVWRWSFGWSTGTNPPVNAVVTQSGYDLDVFHPGGGQMAALPLNMRVTSINSTEDWMTTTYEVTYTFPGPGHYRVEFNNCCRLSTLQGGQADDPMIVRAGITVVPVGQPINRPPVSSSLPIVNVARNTSAQFVVPAFDPDGDPISMNISPTTTSGLNPPAPVGLSIDPGTGVVTWNNAAIPVNSLHAVQFLIADNKGAYTTLDLLLRPVNAVGLPPTVLLNNQPSPQTFNVVRGTPLNVSVRGVDPEGAPVTLTSSNIPIGSVMTPSLPTTASGNVSSTFMWTPAPAQVGTYSVTFSATDGNGQQGSQSMTINVTNEPPTIACTALGGTIEATGPGGALFSLSADLDDPDPADRLVYTVFIDGVLASTQSNLDGPLTVPFSVMAGLGNHTYEARVTDSVSPPVSCSGTFAIVDTTAPTLFLPDNATLDGSGPGAVFTYTATATDIVDTSVPVVCEIPSGSTFSYGVNTVNCIATDDSGNSTPGSFLVTVNDPSAPLITFAISGTAGNNGWYTSNVAVTWTVDDPDSGIESMAGCDPQTVATDTAGVDFTCTAVNNTGVSASATTTSIKRDATAPTISHTVATLVEEATTAAGAVVNYAAPIVADNLSGVDTTTCTHPSGATFPLGSTTVTCTVTDNAGNSSSADLVIQVRDTTPPVLLLPASFAVPATDTTGATVSYAASATDAVTGVASFSCVPASGSLFAIGTTDVACTATDNAGNTATGTFAITVNDTIPPVITDTTPSANSLWPPNHQMVPITIDVAATDNLGPAPVCAVTGVTSNEPQNGLGDGDTPDDWLLTGGLTLQLRAERGGRGDGRIYTIAISCVDGSGNTATSSTTVTVPKSQRR